MDDLAIDQVGHGRNADMRMRSHIETVTCVEYSGAEMVEQDEGPIIRRFEDGNTRLIFSPSAKSRIAGWMSVSMPVISLWRMAMDLCPSACRISQVLERA
ncbi:hypothetical protein [Mesorhizobium sp. M0074]|uniref:hypothetical protein n=1 Tax=Mesorhizobium sp. M0074 TaxID=2956869 RepID=UPI003337222C